MKLIFSQRCLEFQKEGHPESPQRLQRSYEYLCGQEGFEFIEPQHCREEEILLVHTPRLLEEIKSADFYDPDTPSLDRIYEYARLSAGAAIQASEFGLKQGFSFSLMRPPGHHAGRDRLGGFCYFNNIAIAVEKLRRQGKKIAIIDFDCHHGNGTEDIFKGRDSLLYLSLHQSPLYPGTGLESKKNCLNYCLAAGTTEDAYLSIFREGLESIEGFAPDLIAVSAGFDTYKRDPLGGIKLEKSAYKKIGELILQLHRPVFAVLEGGYSKDLPQCVFEFLSAFVTSSQ